MHLSIRKRLGLSLIEICFSVGLLSVALLATLATMHFGMASGEHGSNVSDASGHARQLLEIMLQENRAFSSAALPTAASGFNDAAGVTRPLNDVPFNSATYLLPGNTRFSRHIEVLPCRQAAEGAGGFAWKDDLREVSVTVSWFENGHPRNVNLRSYCKRPR